DEHIRHNVLKADRDESHRRKPDDEQLRSAGLRSIGQPYSQRNKNIAANARHERFKERRSHLMGRNVDRLMKEGAGFSKPRDMAEEISDEQRPKEIAERNGRRIPGDLTQAYFAGE